MRGQNQKSYIHIDKNDLYELFIEKNMTRKKCAEHFKCSEALIKKKCKMYGISKSTKLTHENNKKALKEKFGTENLHMVNVEQQKSTNIERYGTERPFQSDKIQRKVFMNRKNTYSSYERFIADILIKLGVEYEKEKEVVINGKSHFFDFSIEIDSEEILIEIDGEFHVNSHIENGERIKRNIESETIKNNYCFKNDIKLIRIPYFITNEQKENIINETVSPD